MLWIDMLKSVNCEYYFWHFNGICLIGVSHVKLLFINQEIKIDKFFQFLYHLCLDLGIQFFFLVVWNTINLVFLIFNDDLLDAKHWCMFDNSLLMVSSQFSRFSILQYKAVSSAYMIILKLLLDVGRSLIYNKNSNDPKIDLCGTHVWIIWVLDWQPLTSVYCFLFDR